ncbi:MAG: carboxylesterase family protein [Rhodospirillaceae bacterium]
MISIKHGLAALFAAVVIIAFPTGRLDAAADANSYCQQGSGSETVIISGFGANSRSSASVTGCAVSDNPKILAFRGIPYAEAPLGDRRWRPPIYRDLPPSGTYLAYGSSCIQAVSPYRGEAEAAQVIEPARLDEDCLFVNIWAPKEALTASVPLPVMVFIYGGAFAAGSTSEPYYDASRLAAEGVVVVTLNYRVGALGFLRNDAANIAGNDGLLDHRAALTWIRNHIRAFGGAADNVTLFGESAGAASVALHTFDMPDSQALFQRAIIESNPFNGSYFTPSEANSNGVAFLKKLCSVFIINTHHHGGQCSSNTNPELWKPRPPTSEEIMVAQGASTLDMCAGTGNCLEKVINFATPWKPVIDGRVVYGDPIKGYFRLDGVYPVYKPLLMGVNRDEGMVFPALPFAEHSQYFTRENMKTVLNRKFKAPDPTRTAAEMIMSQYEPDSYTSPFPNVDSKYMNGTAIAVGKLIGDYMFVCGTLTALDAIVKDTNNKLPIYAYQFAQPPAFSFFNPADSGVCDPQSAWTDQSAKPAEYYACHANELPYVFNRLETLEGTKKLFGSPISYHATDADRNLAKQMASLWASFAKDMMPAWWTRYDGKGKVIRLANSGEVRTGYPEVSLDTDAKCTTLWLRLSQTSPQER